MADSEPWSYHPSQVARALQAGGVVPGDRVAFIGASGPEFVEVLYGTTPPRRRIQPDCGPDETALIPSLARTASGKLQKQAIRASLSSVAVR